MEIQNLHGRALEISKRFHKAEYELIDILQKIDDAKIWMKFGYSSLFDYALKALKLSESNASNFITVARKSKSVPELKLALQAGEITVSKARKITPVLNKENSSQWLELARTLPKHKLEREVAKVCPQVLTPERAKYISETRMELRMGLKEDSMTKFRRAQDLVSQRTRSAATLQETLDDLLEVYLEQRDPVLKAERVLAKREVVKSEILKPDVAEGGMTKERIPSRRWRKQETLKAMAVNSVTLKKSQWVIPESFKIETGEIDFRFDAPASVPGTRNISSFTNHQVQLRNRGQCTERDKNGQRCENKRWLEVHHKVPKYFGGSDYIDNLKTLCSAHHRREHRF